MHIHTAYVRLYGGDENIPQYTGDRVNSIYGRIASWVRAYFFNQDFHLGNNFSPPTAKPNASSTRPWPIHQKRIGTRWMPPDQIGKDSPHKHRCTHTHTHTHKYIHIWYVYIYNLFYFVINSCVESIEWDVFTMCVINFFIPPQTETDG